MCRDHEGTAHHRDANLPKMRRQIITKPSRSKDAAKTDTHQQQDRYLPVLPESTNQCNRSEERNQHGQCPVNYFVSRQEMSKNDRGGEKHRRENAVNHTEYRSPYA